MKEIPVTREFLERVQTVLANTGKVLATVDEELYAANAVIDELLQSGGRPRAAVTAVRQRRMNAKQHTVVFTTQDDEEIPVIVATQQAKIIAILSHAIGSSPEEPGLVTGFLTLEEIIARHAEATGEILTRHHATALISRIRGRFEEARLEDLLETDRTRGYRLRIRRS